MNDRTNHDQLPSPLIYWEGGIKRRQKDDFKEAMTNPELHLASVTVISHTDFSFMWLSVLTCEIKIIATSLRRNRN